MDDMNQIKRILILVLGILVLQVILSSMILYGLNKQQLSVALVNKDLRNTDNSDTNEIIPQIVKKSTHILGNPDSKVAITMFADFESCLDDVIKQNKTDEEVKYEIEELMGEPIGKLQSMDKDKRNAVLRSIKVSEGVTLRQIARVTGLNVMNIHRS